MPQGYELAALPVFFSFNMNAHGLVSILNWVTRYLNTSIYCPLLLYKHLILNLYWMNRRWNNIPCQKFSNDCQEMISLEGKGRWWVVLSLVYVQYSKKWVHHPSHKFKNISVILKPISVWNFSRFKHVNILISHY